MALVPRGSIVASVRYPEITDTYGLLPGVQPHYGYAAVPEDYPLYRGRPKLPMVWCNGDALVSTDGTVFTGRAPFEITQPDSYASFVASDATWDEASYIWTPIRDNSPGTYAMNGVAGTAPFLDDIEYRIGREFFSQDALVFGTDSVLTTDFNTGIDQSFSLTLAMALNVRDLGRIVTFLDGTTIDATATGVTAVVDGQTVGVRLSKGPTAHTPIFIVLVVQDGVADLNVGFSPTAMVKGSAFVSTRVLGLTFSVTGEIDLFGLDIWGDSAPDPVQIIARYSASLGAVDGSA